MSHFSFRLRFRSVAMRPAVMAACAAALALAGCGQSPRLASTSGLPESGAGAAALPGAGNTGSGGGAAAAFTLPLGAEETEALAPELRVIDAAALPAPGATASANNPPQVVARPNGAKLAVPAGFAVYEWAKGLDNPRQLAVAPNGDVLVAESRANRVVLLRDADGDGRAETKEVFAGGLHQPFGIAFYPAGSASPTHVYVANTDGVVRFAYKAGDGKAAGAAEAMVEGLPGGGYNQHWTRNIAFRPDNKALFVSVGSQSNVGEEEDKRAAILEYALNGEGRPAGPGYRVFASGLRNPVGLAVHPVSGALWTAVNERDGLGDDLVPDYVTSVKEGGFYGWPYFYLGAHVDARVPAAKPELAAKVIVPDVLVGAHTAALGLAFYTGGNFPAVYKNHAFVALHGSWNRAERSGYQVVRVPIGADGRATGGFEPFLTGWKTNDGQVWGRPVAVAVDKQGGLLITDDGANKVWRVLYGGEKAVAAAARKKATTPAATAATTATTPTTVPAPTPAAAAADAKPESGE